MNMFTYYPAVLKNKTRIVVLRKRFTTREKDGREFDFSNTCDLTLWQKNIYRKFDSRIWIRIIRRYMLLAFSHTHVWWRTVNGFTPQWLGMIADAESANRRSWHVEEAMFDSATLKIRTILLQGIWNDLPHCRLAVGVVIWFPQSCVTPWHICTTSNLEALFQSGRCKWLDNLESTLNLPELFTKIPAFK